MSQLTYLAVNNYLQFIIPIIVPLLLFLAVYNWKRRYLNYYSAKLPGPFGLPFIGSLHLVKDGPESIYKFLTSLFEKYPSVFKIWIGPDLYVSTTEPHHLKTILTQHFDKGDFYKLMSEYFQRALAAAPVHLWKQNRKNINPTFNVSLINSFVDVFNKHAHILAEELDKECGKESKDIFPIVWKCTLDAACETLADADSKLLKSEEFITKVFRIEEILLERFFNPFLHLNLFWKFSSKRKELLELWRNNCYFIEKVINLQPPNEKESFSKKKFLNHLVDLSNNNDISFDYVLEESQIMFFVGTETSGVALSSTLVVLGMYPEVQKKIDEELDEIFEGSDRDPTLEDANRMDYLERVIKETLRLLPPIPFVMRNLDENLKLDSHIFPAGSRVIIPLTVVHKKPEFWPDPLKFEPDRFLPEEVEKRPACSYIPFSYGIRNCIGYKYALLSMKIILSRILRKFRVKSSNYRSIKDMDLLIHVVAKPKKGFKVTLERKNK